MQNLKFCINKEIIKLDFFFSFVYKFRQYNVRHKKIQDHNKEPKEQR